MDTATPLLALALALLLVLTGLRDRVRRPWLLLFLASLVLVQGLAALPGLVPGERVLGNHWNWSGGLLGLTGAGWVAGQLVRRCGLSWRDMGFTLAQAPASLPGALLVSTAALTLHMLSMNQDAIRLAGVPAETWLYQATLPGLMEETVFRGVLLALLDRAYSARKSVLGVDVGWGGVVVTLVFVALHGITPGTLLGVLPAALLTLWLRLRTGSLVLPVLVHNLWNLSVYAAHV